ncbi:MAG: hypothetical protein GX897_10180 [Clostridiales bacterium]|nr:hypothetical protein [Clostridiales bacterium]
MKKNEYKLYIALALGAQAFALLIVALIQKIRRDRASFRYFIASAICSIAGLLFAIEKFSWDSDVAGLKSGHFDIKFNPGLDSLVNNILHSKDSSESSCEAEEELTDEPADESDETAEEN